MFRTSYVIQHIIFLIHVISFTSNYLAAIPLQPNIGSSFPFTVSINSIPCFIATYYVHQSLLYDFLSTRRSYGNTPGSTDPKRI